MFEFAILGLSVFVNLLLGVVVFQKDPKSATNKLFLGLTSTFAAWSLVNYASIHPFLFEQIIWVRLVLLLAALLCLMVFLTFTVFPSAEMEGDAKIRRAAILYTAFVMILTQTPFVFGVDSNGSPVAQPPIVFFTILVVGLLGGGIFNSIKKYRNSSGVQRNQLRFVLFGLLATFGLILFTNFVIVVLFNHQELISLGSAYTLIFSGCFAYAIVKHRLFDIRTAVARASGYVLSLGSIVFVYSIVVFGLSESIPGGDSVSTVQRAFYVGCAIITALMFQPVKRFFDRLSNRIFFRDAYDPQQFLDQLNRALVSNVELDTLLLSSAQVIESNLKTDYCTFTIAKSGDVPGRTVGTRKLMLTQEDTKLIEQHTPSLDAVVIIDEIAHEEGFKELHQVLDAHNTAVLIRLVAKYRNKSTDLGFIMLGAKKNGNTYTNADLKLLNIIANELVIAIENSLRFEEIERFTVTLQEKVNDATRQLRRTNEKLKALDETKDEFISMASHQLRTPLTSVKGYLSMVLEGDTGKITPAQQKLLDQAFISSQRMVYLIADLLNVSRLRTGKFVIEAAPMNLADAIEGEIGQLRETAKGRGLELTYVKPDKFPTLMLDETKIRQVLMNFIDNAIYYTPSGGHIAVNLQEVGPSIEFTVVDDGLGVPKAEQHHLFNKFYRAGNARKARPDGTGLGLFMAKKVVVAQGGNIIFKSTEGKGSTFGFSFAKAKLLPPAHLAQHDTTKSHPEPEPAKPSVMKEKAKT